jgi:ClpP class serine protease
VTHAQPKLARYLPKGFLALSPQAFGAEFTVTEPVSKPYDVHDGVAVIEICGPLEQKANWLWDSYESIQARAEAAFTDPAVRAVVMRINSPGGDATGCFELARTLRAMAEDTKKPLYTYTDGLCASAAYALGSAANAGFYAIPTANVGNISVYHDLPNVVAQDAALGIQHNFIVATGDDLKLANNPHLEASEAVKDFTQDQVNDLRRMFVGLVSEFRGMPDSQVTALRGALLLGEVALNNSLIDGLSDWPTFLAELPQGRSMAIAKATDKEPKAGPSFEEALAALHAAAEGEDEERAGKARRMIAAMYPPEEKKADAGDGDGDKKEEAKSKSEGSEEEKKDEEKADAKAMASAAPSTIELAAQLHAVQAKLAAKEEDEARAALFAQRPDFSAEVRKTLATASLKVLKNAVDTWPRVAASALSSASAQTAQATQGRPEKGADPTLRPDQQALLDRVYGSASKATGPTQRGTEFQLTYSDPAVARARLAEYAAKKGTV